MQLMLVMEKKCNEFEVRHNVDIQQRGQEQTLEQSIWVTLSDLENNTDSDDN